MVIFVLGAPNFEMGAIEYLLSSNGIHYTYALTQDGERVTSENAYESTNLACFIGFSVYTLYLVDCQLSPHITSPFTIFHIDRKAGKSFESSLLGQVYGTILEKRLIL